MLSSKRNCNVRRGQRTLFPFIVVPKLLVPYMLFFFQLYDGDNENANLVGTFCGSAVPAPFLSTRNSLTVKFITDNSVEREGFNATYTTVDRKYTCIHMHIYCCECFFEIHI